MSAYRYFFFAPDGKIRAVEVSDQADDDVASLRGAALLERAPNDVQAVEVWQLARRVCRLERAP